MNTTPTDLEEKKIKVLMDKKVTFETLFDKATLNPNAALISTVSCGYRIEEMKIP